MPLLRGHRRTSGWLWACVIECLESMVHFCGYCTVVDLLLAHQDTGDAMLAQRLSPPPQTSTPTLDVDDPYLYINRELSWLQFNWRVLEEALDEGHALLERVKFLAIFANNLDEFFMIRVSGLRRQVTG